MVTTAREDTIHDHRSLCVNCGQPEGTREGCREPEENTTFAHTFIRPLCARCNEVVVVEVTRKEAYTIGRYISRAYYGEFNWPPDAYKFLRKFEELAK